MAKKWKIELWDDKHHAVHKIDWLPNVGDIIYLSVDCEFAKLSKTFSFRVKERIIWDDKWSAGTIEAAIKVVRAYRNTNHVPIKCKITFKKS